MCTTVMLITLVLNCDRFSCIYANTLCCECAHSLHFELQITETAGSPTITPIKLQLDSAIARHLAIACDYIDVVTTNYDNLVLLCTGLPSFLLYVYTYNSRVYLE